MIRFLGQDITWWTGTLGGAFLLLLIGTSLVKQFNWKIFMRWQIKLTVWHHWFGWLTFGFLAIHMLLAYLQFNFGVVF